MKGGKYFSKLDRYELKYIIPFELIEPISAYLLNYCVLDTHSLKAKDGFYPISSLYFDTPNYTFLKNRLYTKNPRFNMRVRHYGGDAPYFLEIKYKDSTTVQKYRAKLDKSEYPAIFEDYNYRTHLQGEKSEQRNKELFYKTALKYNATPKIFTHYRRKAFVSTVDEYVRVTMDIELSAYEQESYTLQTNHTKLTPYDNENIFVKEADQTSGSGVVLELKCYPTQVPLWMVDMIRRFELTRTSFSKYANALLSLKRLDPSHGEFYNFADRASSE